MVDMTFKVIQQEGIFYLGIVLINKSLSHELQKYANYDNQLKLYKCTMDQYPQLLANSHFKMDPLPIQVSKCIPLPKQVSESDVVQFQNHVNLLKDPSAIHPYQWLPAKCLLQTNKIMLSDEMGLGKTIQSIASLSIINKWPVLISAPTSLISNWENELLKWTNIGPYHILKIRKGSDIETILPNLKLNMRKIILCTVDLCAKYAVKFENKFQFGILDEAHSIKNETTLRYKGMCAILKTTPYTILITGTPITGKIEELYTQLKICRPHLYKDKYQFGSRYANVREMTLYNMKIKTFDGSKNEPELYYILQDTMIRRRKSDLLSNTLKEKNRTCVVRSINEIHLKPCAALFQQIKSKNHNSYKNDDDIIRDAMRGGNPLWLELYRATATAKIQMVKDYLLEMFECMNGCHETGVVDGVSTGTINGILFFCHHQVMLKEIEQFCQTTGTEYILIDGETKPDKRQALVDTFQNNKYIKIALLSIRAANTGLTLTKASHVVFGEMAWSFSDMEQAEDRCHRIGQVNKVESIVLLGKGTIDKQLWNLLNKKQNIVSQCMDGIKSKVDADFSGNKQEMDKEKGSNVNKLTNGQTTLNFKTTNNENHSNNASEIVSHKRSATTVQQQQQLVNEEDDENWFDFEVDEHDYQMAVESAKKKRLKQ